MFQVRWDLLFDDVITNLLLSVMVREFRKSLSIF